MGIKSSILLPHLTRAPVCGLRRRSARLPTSSGRCFLVTRCPRLLAVRCALSSSACRVAGKVQRQLKVRILLLLDLHHSPDGGGESPSHQQESMSSHSFSSLTFFPVPPSASDPLLTHSPWLQKLVVSMLPGSRCLSSHFLPPLSSVSTPLCRQSSPSLFKTLILRVCLDGGTSPSRLDLEVEPSPPPATSDRQVSLASIVTHQLLSHTSPSPPCLPTSCPSFASSDIT